MYRRDVEPERHLGIFSLDVVYYPQLVAGPIERAFHFLPQLRLLRTPDPKLAYDETRAVEESVRMTADEILKVLGWPNKAPEAVRGQDSGDTRVLSAWPLRPTLR